MPTKYTTLLIDADETLLDFCRSERKALGEALAAAGIAITEDIYQTYHAVNSRLWKKLETGELLRSRLKVQRFEELFAYIGCTGQNAAAVNENYMQRLACYGFLLDGAMQTVKRLSERYAIYIITNGSACVQHTRLEDSGLLPFVKGVFVSEEVGADKPSKAYFSYVFSHIEECDRQRILVIGDSLTSDIRGGLLAGLDTCWYNPGGFVGRADINPTFEVRSFDELCRQLLL